VTSSFQVIGNFLSKNTYIILKVRGQRLRSNINNIQSLKHVVLLILKTWRERKMTSCQETK